ncbi:MAG: Nif3-like dinuclear metal center hexameric protein [Methanobacteriaceae archaeon]|nr:Nif3-like dinuclear metal center hexameric protein [Methanobacteriaceae archaeon]
MIASELFRKIEKKIPLEIALKGDKVGFIGPGHPDKVNIENILILMDYVVPGEVHYCQKPKKIVEINYYDFDLLITHHPPIIQPKIPTYVIHSNWDLIEGGSCDALADILKIEVTDVLDKNTGMGKVGKPINGPILMENFINLVMEKLDLDYLKTLNTSNFSENSNCSTPKIEKIALISGFGLKPEFIRLAHDKGADIFISGDLTHPGAILAKNLGIGIIDATHHATELPGLRRLGTFISDLGMNVEVVDTCIPWIINFKDYE